MGGSVRTLLTTYGPRELETASLHGSAVQYLMADHVIPAGAMWDGDRKLVEPVRWRSGTIMMPRLLSDGSGAFIWSAFKYGIYEALRGVMHTKHGYAGWNDDAGEEVERGELLLLEDVNEALSLALSWLALRPKLTKKEQEALRALVAAQVTEVGAVRDVRKQRALVRMLNAQCEQDILKRNNPSARMAIVVGAQGDFQDRLALIRYIEPRIGSREIALLLEAARIKRIFIAAYKNVEEVRDGYRLSNRFDWTPRMELVRRDLETIKVGPYPVHIERLLVDLCEAEDAMKHFTTAVVKEKLRIVMESIRCKRARWELEEFLVRMSLFTRQRGHVLDVDTVERFAREIPALRERVAVRINDTGFEKPVRQMVCDDLAEAETRLMKVRPLNVKLAKACVERAARRL